MDDEIQRLIDGYHDDVLSPDEWQRLSTLLKEDTTCAHRFAMASLLHDRLHAVIGLSGSTSQTTLALCPVTQLPWTRRRWSLAVGAALAATLLLSLILPQGGGLSTASAANLAIEQMIEAAGLQIVRVYRIHITDHGPAGPAPQVMSGGGGRKPSVDGAELYVFGLDQFVLIRRFGNGMLFITGSDGEVGWAVPPKGPVHLSRDARRFRRGVPGEHEEIPFLDLRVGLEALRRDYVLSLVPSSEAGFDANGWSRLDGIKHARVRGGPERVQIWFDVSGVAQRIALIGLPPGEPDGSPHSVELELSEHREVRPDFFQHQSHHVADRPVSWE